jgi:hypothetical protein
MAADDRSRDDRRQLDGVACAQSTYGRAKPTLNRVIGTMLAAFGIAIVIERGWLTGAS